MNAAAGAIEEGGAVDRVVLTGFMGSGKTTVGRLLAVRWGWRFLDLDEEIERRERRSVPRIFAESGEERFRELETEALAAVLEERRVVIALGGGALEQAGNSGLLEQNASTVVVHLTAPFAVLVERCRQQEGATERPVLADLEAAERRFEARHRIHERVAAVTIETTAMGVEETVEAVVVVALVVEHG